MHYLPPSPPSSPTDSAPVPTARVKRIRLDNTCVTQAPRSLDMNLLTTYLGCGGSPNVRDRHGISLLCRACQLSSLTALKRLTQHTALDIDAPHGGSHRQTALHIAVSMGWDEGVLHLVQCGAKIDRTDALGWTPLDLAIRRRRDHCFSLLLSAYSTEQLRAYKNCDDRSLFEEAIMIGSLSILKQLLARTQPNLSQLIDMAIEWNRIDCLDHLLSLTPASLDLHHTLYRAVQQRKVDMVQKLEQNGANPCHPTHGRNSCLLYAATHGFVDMIPMLLTKSTRPSCIQQALLLADTAGCRSHVSAAIYAWQKSHGQA